MMEKVLKPKIDGTNHLDELFHDIDLDFFVLFSSLSAVIGNAGQSNYAAANTYLASVTAQRKKRGLAASTFDIGRVVGLGYVEKAGQGLQNRLSKMGIMPISETDFHQMFAETIQAGRSESSASAVVITGLDAMRDDEDAKASWVDNPRFSHCIVETGMEDSKKESKKTVLPLADQLRSTTSKEEVLETLKGMSVHPPLPRHMLNPWQNASPPECKSYYDFLRKRSTLKCPLSSWV